MGIFDIFNPIPKQFDYETRRDFEELMKDFDMVFKQTVTTTVPFQEQAAFENKQEAGKRYDAGKLRYDLLPVDAVREVVRVYTKGAEKYADRNWEKGMSWSRCIGPLMRHLEAFREGKIWDDGIDPVTGQPGTGCHHMAMVAWNALALVAYERRGIGTNDLGWENYANDNSPVRVKDNNEPITAPTFTSTPTSTARSAGTKARN